MKTRIVAFLAALGMILGLGLASAPAANASTRSYSCTYSSGDTATIYVNFWRGQGYIRHFTSASVTNNARYVARTGVNFRPSGFSSQWGNSTSGRTSSVSLNYSTDVGYIYLTASYYRGNGYPTLYCYRTVSVRSM